MSINDFKMFIETTPNNKTKFHIGKKKKPYNHGWGNGNVMIIEHN